MILLWGILEDTPMQMVHDEFMASSTPFFFLNHRDISETKIQLNYQNGLCVKLSCNNQELDLSQVTAAYFRPYDFHDYEEFESKKYNDPLILHASSIEQTLWAWAESCNALIINKLSASATNQSKPYQLSLIRRIGFNIPDTLITTNPQSALEFKNKHSEVIYKSVSAFRSIVRKFSDDDEKHLEDIRCCPTLFQQYIDGADYRTHVIGEKVLTVRISSQETDYRYGESEIEPAELPKEIEKKCIKITQELGLEFSGIDLRKSSSGKWYCFEVNPSPAYSYFQLKSGVPISSVLAEYLKQRIFLKNKPDFLGNSKLYQMERKFRK